MQEQLVSAGYPPDMAKDIQEHAHFGALPPGFWISMLAKYGPAVLQIIQDILSGNAQQTGSSKPAS